MANLTVHLSAGTETAGGARYIEYHSEGSLAINGVRNPFANEDVDFDTTIYSVSIKHNFNDDLMLYVSTGVSWRPGISAIGDFSLAQSPRERSFSGAGAGRIDLLRNRLRASAWEDRLRYSVAAYHQEFDNYHAYRSPPGVYFVNTPSLVPTMRS